MDGHTEVPTLPPGVPGHSRGELSVDVVGLQWNKLPRHQPRSPVLLIRCAAVPLTLSKQCIDTEGQPACSTLLSARPLAQLPAGPVSQLAGAVKRADCPPCTSCRWWGDSSSGTYLPATPGESLAFPICCGPKYLTRYLRDVATLPIRVVEFTNSQTIGQGGPWRRTEPRRTLRANTHTHIQSLPPHVCATHPPTHTHTNTGRYSESVY